MRGDRASTAPSQNLGTRQARPEWRRLLGLGLLAVALCAPVPGRSRAREQVASLETIFYRGDPSLASGALALPDRTERRDYRTLQKARDAEALDLVGELYGRRLRPLAVRDTDGDGIPDFRLSDYFGKLLEGDLDVDGDGVRNILDGAPFDPRAGGRDEDGDGMPEPRSFEDRNGNGLPDHLDWSQPDRKLDGERGEMAGIQLGLFRDHGIVLVERDAPFDLPLAQAVDDAVRFVFGEVFREHGRMPTLRTVATERQALLSERRAARADDWTGAQVFSQTQTLVVYDEGRSSRHPVVLLGLLVHEMAHAWQLALDFDTDDPRGENRRTEFPAPKFVALVDAFGWQRVGWEDNAFAGELPVQPLFAYAGMSQPIFAWRGKSPDEWAAWIEEIWTSSGQSADFMSEPAVVERGVVSEYSLTTPYEWHSDNLLAYVVVVMEEEARKVGWLAAESAAEPLIEALREVWPTFHPPNIAPEVMDHCRSTFPISDAGRHLLAERYLLPVLLDGAGN